MHMILFRHHMVRLPATSGRSPALRVVPDLQFDSSAKRKQCEKRVSAAVYLFHFTEDWQRLHKAWVCGCSRKKSLMTIGSNLVFAIVFHCK